MICEVVKVEESDDKSYTLANNKTCSKFLHLKAGQFETKAQIIYISDKPMIQKDFDKFIYFRNKKEAPVNNK